MDNNCYNILRRMDRKTLTIFDWEGLAPAFETERFGSLLLNFLSTQCESPSGQHVVPIEESLLS